MISRYPVATLALAFVCLAAQGQALSKNPFSRPAYMVELQEAPAPAFLAAPEPLELRATLVSDGQSLADINGEILAAGDVYEGHRLLQIREGRVVLIKDGERTMLDLYEETDERDE